MTVTGLRIYCYAILLVIFKILFIFVNFIGVTFVNNIIQILGVQLYNVGVYSLVCSPPEV